MNKHQKLTFYKIKLRELTINRAVHSVCTFYTGTFRSPRKKISVLERLETVVYT